MISNWFAGSKKGGSKKTDANAREATINQWGNQISDLEAKIDVIEKQTNSLTNAAKEKLKAKDPTAAKKLLAKKKKWNEQIKQYEGAIGMMEEQKMMLESADTMKNLFTSIKQGNAAIKEATKGMNIEDLEDMREDMEELKSTQNEIGDFFKDYNAEEDPEIDEDLKNWEDEMNKEEAVHLEAANKEVIHQPKITEKVAGEKDWDDFLS